MSIFKNRVVVITGGSEGIGKAIVEKLLYHGAKVATCARNYDKLYLLQSKNPDKPLMVYSADISKESECKSFIEAVIKNFGNIDILINNAGISMRSLFQDVSLDTLRMIMQVNFWGAVYCTKFSLPYILESKGSVVAVSSVAGYRGVPGRSGYSASKFALNGWMESLRTELLYSGVNVLWICPGFIASNIRKTSLGSKATIEEVSTMNESAMMTCDTCADHIIKAIEKRKRTIILTSQGKQTVWINKIVPYIADHLVRKFYYKKNELVK